MTAAAKPYDYAAFDAPKPDRREAISYSQDELDAAADNARAEAFASIEAEELRKQTALVADLAARLDAIANEALDGWKESLAGLCETARTLVGDFCIAASVVQQKDAALALIDRHIAAEPHAAPARLQLSTQTEKPVIAALNKALEDRTANDVVMIETSAELAPGEMRLAWRGGVMERNHAQLKSQLADIFGALAENGAPLSQKKGPYS